MPIHLPAYVDRACNARFANWIRLALLITCCLDTCRGWMPSLFRTTPSTIWRMLDSWCNIDRVSRVMVEWNYFLLSIVRSNFLNYRGESKRTWDVGKMIRNICKTRFLKWMLSRHYFQGNAVSGIMKIHAPLETIYTYVYVGRNIEKYRRFMRWKIRVILRGFLQICKIAVEKIANEHSRVKIFLNIWEENEKINPD